MDLSNLWFYLKNPKRIMCKLGIVHDEYCLIEWKHFGSLNPDKKIVLYFASGLPAQGILSAWNGWFYTIKELRDVGYELAIDIVDFMEYKKHNYLAHNEWEDVFEQPCGIPMSEVLQSANVGIPHFTLKKQRLLIRNEYNAEHYRLEGNYIKENIWMKASYEEEIKRKIKAIWPQRGKVLAVVPREEFNYFNQLGNSFMWRHPKEPPIQQIIDKANQLMGEWDCEYCFIATAYEATIRLFREVLGDKLIYVERKRQIVDDAFINGYIEFAQTKTAEEEYEVYKRIQPQAFDADYRDAYLLEMYAASQSDCLLASKNGGSIAAMYWNCGKYEHTYIFRDENHSKTY